MQDEIHYIISVKGRFMPDRLVTLNAMRGCAVQFGVHINVQPIYLSLFHFLCLYEKILCVVVVSCASILERALITCAGFDRVRRWETYNLVLQIF
jgi:hypothetical protein